MAGAIDRIFGRSFTFLNTKESLSGKRADRLAERFDRTEENLERKENKILERIARLEGVSEDIKDKEKDKDKVKKKDAAVSATQERLEQRLAEIQEKKDKLALIRAQVFGEEQSDDEQDGSDNTNTVIDDLDDDDAVTIDFSDDDDVNITPADNSGGNSDAGPYQFTKGDLRHGQLRLRELETASLRVKNDAEYLNRSEELIDKQIEAAEDVQYELRKGRDPDRLQQKQEVLFSLMEEKYLLDEALRKRKGQESEDFDADPAVFQSVPDNIEFIKEKEDEKRNVISLQETVARQETNLSQEIDTAKTEISRIAKFQIDNLPTDQSNDSGSTEDAQRGDEVGQANDEALQLQVQNQLGQTEQVLGENDDSAPATNITTVVDDTAQTDSGEKDELAIAPAESAVELIGKAETEVKMAEMQINSLAGLNNAPVKAEEEPTAEAEQVSNPTRQAEDLDQKDENLAEAKKTAKTLETNIPRYPKEAEDAHYWLDQESGKLLIDD